jgi:CheY-like chemotaxis protein
MSLKLWKETIMKILVIDDSRVNLEAAKQTLQGHELSLCDSYDKAVGLLEVTYDDGLIKQKLVAAGFPPTTDGLNMPKRDQWGEQEHARWDAWWKAFYKLKQESQVPYWDAVLADLLMPAGQDAQGDKGFKFVGQQMPVGFALALLAAKNGAKYVAVVTATNHHNHPASAMLDRLGSAYWRDEDASANFVINGAKAMFVHHRPYFVEGIICPKCNGAKYTKEPCRSCSIDGVPTGQKVDWQKRVPIPGTVCEACDGTKQSLCYTCSKTGKAEGKDWGMVLKALCKE